MKREQPSGKGEKKREKKRRGALWLFRWGTPLPVLFLLAAGIALFFVNAENLYILSIVTGLLLCFAALLLFVGAFWGNASVLQIVCGVALVALAVWLFVQPEEGRIALYYVLTGIVLLRALVGLFYALLAKRKESRLWQISMTGSIFLLVCAVVYFFLPILKPGAQNVLLGVLCCLDGIFEIAAMFHRLTAARREEKSAPRRATRRGEKEEQADGGTSAESTEIATGTETERKPFWRRLRKKKEKTE